MDMKVQIENSVIRVTPEMARAWLERNQNNRPIHNAIVEKYAEDMRNGNWQLNGQTIKIARSGRLLDGQHRLKGIIKANVSIDTFVVTGLSEDVFTTIDVGIKRTTAQILQQLHYKNSGALAAAARWLIVIQDKLNIKEGSVSEANIIEAVEQHPLLKKYVAIPQKEKLLISGSLGAVTLAAEKYGERTVDKFLAGFLSGANLKEGSPELELRTRLIASMKSVSKLTTEAKIVITIKALKAFAAGKTVTLLRYSTAENFPEL